MSVEEHIAEDKKKSGGEYNINRRRRAKQNLDPNDALVLEIGEFSKSTIRSKAEYVFGVVKCLFRFRRTRYRALRTKNGAGMRFRLHICFLIVLFGVALTKRAAAPMKSFTRYVLPIGKAAG